MRFSGPITDSKDSSNISMVAIVSAALRIGEGEGIRVFEYLVRSRNC